MLRRLHSLDAIRHPDLMIGIDDADDGAVFRVTDDLALIQTVDFFTPIVDDPREWGRIAAANALSDVYAMGGSPLTALQLIAWPRAGLAFDVLGEVMAGGAEILQQAGCALVGGHSIDDDEPKYGFAVTGTVHPDDVVATRGASAGDVLVLTKPIGTGIISTAVKRGVVEADQQAAAIESMTRLNAGAARAMHRIGVRAATDVTGFGLLGHLGEMVRASNASAELSWSAVPKLPGVVELAAAGIVPGGTERNLVAANRFTRFGSIDAAEQRVLADAQTSGGLLIAVDRGLEKALLQALADEDVAGVVVGRMVDRTLQHGPLGAITVLA